MTNQAAPNNPQELSGKLDEVEKALAGMKHFDASTAKKIAEARRLLKDGKTADAEVVYTEIKLRLHQAEASVRAEPIAWKLLSLEVAYLLFLLFFGYAVHRWPSYRLWGGLIGLNSGTAWFGALGGIAIALLGIYTHVQARDFDAEYVLWYICKPLTGAIFGWFVCLIFRIGIVSVQGSTAGNQTNQVQNPLLLYAIAFLAGYSERFTTRIIDRLMQVLTTWEDKPAGTSSAAPPGK
jgi:hypothetical protein